MKKVGLFFGTFNPVHIGHLALAEFIQKTTDLEEVWLVVTPLNPFKKKSNLLPDRERLHLVRLALEDQMGLKASDIEFNLPKPNYTAQTLAYLREKYPEIIFSVIMGEDNIKTLHKWRNYESIADNHDIFVYPRHPLPKEEKNHFDWQEKYPRSHLVNAPKMELSASMIRKSFAQGKGFRNLLPKAVFDYIEGSNLFK
jgi:nicotinate-nucleotide adenylyltransferase